MFWVTKSLSRLRADDDGISFVFVAIVMVALIGMVAFAVDAGALYQERRELQNGSDAAVLAIAEDCARGVGTCDTPTAEATAQEYADANSGDNAADIVSPVNLDLVEQTIEVITQTKTSDGGTVFKPFFAQVLGFDGATVRARSKAIWGVPGGANQLPITISKCEWDKIALIYGEPPTFPDVDTLNYVDWEAAYGGPPSTHGFTFFLHSGNNADPCNGPAGQDIPGGFGWLDQNTTEDCTATTSDGDGYPIDFGADAPDPECPSTTVAGYLGTKVFIPVFFEVNGGEYFMNGYMALYLTGYKLGGQPAWTQSLPGLPDACSMDDRCIQGYPTDGTCWNCTVIPGGGGNNFGVLAIRLTD